MEFENGISSLFIWQQQVAIIWLVWNASIGFFINQMAIEGPTDTVRRLAMSLICLDSRQRSSQCQKGPADETIFIH